MTFAPKLLLALSLATVVGQAQAYTGVTYVCGDFTYELGRLQEDGSTGPDRLLNKNYQVVNARNYTFNFDTNEVHFKRRQYRGSWIEASVTRCTQRCEGISTVGTECEDL